MIYNNLHQYHHANGVHNFICGASGSDQREGSGFVGGINSDVQLDWVGGPNDVGFVAVNLTRDQMQVDFVGLEGEIYKQVIVTKEVKPWLPSPAGYTESMPEFVQQEV